MSEHQCPKCNSEMAVGYLFDAFGYDVGKQSTWVEGMPARSWLSGLMKTRGRTTLRVQTYRCARCGYLESFAPEPETVEKS